MSRTIVVLRRDIHGMPIEGYVDAIRERLPDQVVRHATNPREEREYAGEAEIVTGLSPEGLLAHADRLELFQCLYAGTEHLPLERLHDQGIAVTSAAGVHGPNIAEWVIGMILTFARRLHTGFRRAERREWRHFQADELYGSTVTIVGLGTIGSAVADRLGGFGVETIGVRYTPDKGGPTDEVVGFDADAFHDALARTDYLVIACPLTETTDNLIDAEAFETLPPSAVLVNIARGPIVDTGDLVRELQTGGIKGAALDVTDPEPLPEDHRLWTFDNVLITPHNSGHTPAYYERVADILAENVRHLDENGPDAAFRNQVVPG